MTMVDFSTVRPMIGLDPSNLEELEGRTTKIEIAPGQGVNNEMFME